nr:RNA-dependent RNA polymerase [Partitiviridae sp.]
MKSISTLRSYNYTSFLGDLVNQGLKHPHIVRREEATTYVDRFAMKVVEVQEPLAYEQSLKDWSRSYYLKSDHMKAVMAYSSPNIPTSHIHVPTYQECIEVVKNGLSSLPQVRAFDVLSELDQVTYKPSSAAGYDYVGAKGPQGGENHKRAIKRAKAVLWSVIADDGEGIEHAIQTSVPDVGYTRTQLTDLSEKTKIRQVWGRAFHYILLEGVVADPFIQAIAQGDTFIHTGEDPVISVPYILSKVSSQSSRIYSLDWKSFDATVSRFEMNTAFDIIKSYILFPNIETEAAFEISRQLFIHKKVAAPDGYIYEAHKGIPSGSYFTSIVGSIVNRLRIEYLWKVITGHGPRVCYTLGDDSLVGDDEYVAVTELAEVANHIGWYFNPDKTEFSKIPEGVSFLGRTSVGGLNTRDLKKCLRLLVYPEYPVESGDISAYRARAIAEDSGGLSNLLNRVAGRLECLYGIASEEDVPVYFKRYVMFR